MLFRKHCFDVLSLPNFRVHLRRGSRKIVLHSCFIYLFIYVSYLCIYIVYNYILYIYILNILYIYIYLYLFIYYISLGQRKRTLIHGKGVENVVIATLSFLSSHLFGSFAITFKHESLIVQLTDLVRG